MSSTLLSIFDSLKKRKDSPTLVDSFVSRLLISTSFQLFPKRQVRPTEKNNISETDVILS